MHQKLDFWPIFGLRGCPEVICATLLVLTLTSVLWVSIQTWWQQKLSYLKYCIFDDMHLWCAASLVHICCIIFFLRCIYCASLVGCMSGAMHLWWGDFLVHCIFGVVILWWRTSSLAWWFFDALHLWCIFSALYLWWDASLVWWILGMLHLWCAASLMWYIYAAMHLWREASLVSSIYDAMHLWCA